jgi:NAD(P)-dependent dehydrogenase (short-subunit alcohol dehydrogenase family)
MFIPKRTLTTDGFEMHMGINHFGHFYLTSLLWPYLKDSKDLKIINVSSLVHAHTVLLKAVSIDFEDLNFEKGYDPYLAYSKSKLCNILFTKELSKRIQKINSNARVVCLHPGVVRTEIMRYVKKGIIDFLYMLIEPIYWVFSKNSKEGAQTTLYTIYETNDKLLNGGYYSECKLKGVSSEASKV